jgi:hypothetical protein
MLLIGFPLIALGASADSPVTIVLAVVILVVLMLVISVISSTLQGIYTAALYRYATNGTAGGFFDDETMRSAFRHK